MPELEQTPLLLTVEIRLTGRVFTLLALRRRFKPLFDGALPDTELGSRYAAKHLGGLFVVPRRAIGIDLQQHIGMLDFLGYGCAPTHQSGKHDAFVFRQSYDVLLLHPPFSWQSTSRDTPNSMF